MIEDIFIREVNKEIRLDNLNYFWKSYRLLLIGFTIIVIISFVIFQIRSTLLEHEASRIGDSLLTVIEKVDNADYDAALIKLDEIEKSDFGSYPVLAKMYKSSILAARGDKVNAVAAFDAVSANFSTPKILKEIALVRAAYILIDIGSFIDVENHVKSFATDINPMRFAAWETLGLSAWKVGKIEDATYYFNRIYQDKDAILTGFYKRADIMLNLIYSQTNKQKI